MTFFSVSQEGEEEEKSETVRQAEWTELFYW